MSFPAEPQHVEQMRRITVARLKRCGFASQTIRAAEHVVSELVTNAITHGRSAEIDFTLVCEFGREVRIEVDDHSPGTLQPRVAGPDDENGRGLLLVEAFAQSWGRTGTRTWCVVSAGEAQVPLPKFDRLPPMPEPWCPTDPFHRPDPPPQ